MEGSRTEMWLLRKKEEFIRGEIPLVLPTDHIFSLLILFLLKSPRS